MAPARRASSSTKFGPDPVVVVQLQQLAPLPLQICHDVAGPPELPTDGVLELLVVADEL
jgi:hypothetical protein